MSKPAKNIRDGNIAAAIWKNEGEKGAFYSVDFSRTYTDDKSGEVKNSNSFSGSELLRVARLANMAYDEISELRKADRNPQTADGKPYV